MSTDVPVGKATNTFFSYSRKHADVVKDFYSFSTIFAGSHFLDERSIPLGADFPDAIENAIDRCDVFVLLWCACASDSNWVKRELEKATEKEKRIVPILLSEYPLPPVIERVNGIRLHFGLCAQKAIGLRPSSRHFVDNYQDLDPGSQKAVLSEIEKALTS